MMRVLIEHAKNPGGRNSGVLLFRFGEGGLIPRLATDYSSPSSHLQMQQAATPARTERTNDESSLTEHAPPFLYLYRGGSSVNYSIEAEILQQMQKKVYCSELCRTKNPWYTKIAEAHTGQAVTPKGVFFMPFGMKKTGRKHLGRGAFFLSGSFCVDFAQRFIYDT